MILRICMPLAVLSMTDVRAQDTGTATPTEATDVQPAPAPEDPPIGDPPTLVIEPQRRPPQTPARSEPEPVVEPPVTSPAPLESHTPGESHTLDQSYTPIGPSELPEPHTPNEPPAPVPQPQAVPEPSGPFASWPEVPEHSFFSFLALLLGAGVAAGAAELAVRIRRRLAPRGILPQAAAITQTLGRGFAVILLLGALAAVIPKGLQPVLPWVAVAGALALGWSLRDVLPDVVAWTFLSAEGRMQPGMWVRGESFEGRIEAISLRATWVVDTRGARTSIPNRLLIRAPVRATVERWPEAEVCVHLPEAGAAVARAALKEAAMLSPWIAPAGQPEIGQDPADVTRWTVRIRVLDGRYRDRFEGTFPERVRDVLTAREPG